jgi:DNA mismatch endonuclease (patch repair protein)
MDTRSTEQRRRIMQAVKSKDTEPELRVRRLLHSMHLRFRLHRKDLPGRPDIVLPRHRKVIFVHGCFWHAHGCSKGQPPKSRHGYWLPKLQANVHRDQAKITQLEQLNWKVLVVWQCETKDTSSLGCRLQDFVDEE